MEKRKRLFYHVMAFVCELAICAILLAIRRRRKIRNNDRDSVDHCSGLRVLGGDDDDNEQRTRKRTG